MSTFAPHIALLRNGADEMRAVIVPVDHSIGLDVNDERPWLLPYLEGDWHLFEMVPIAFVPDEPGDPRSWPAGDPNEAEIRAKIDRDLERLVVVVRRGDIERLDKVTVFVEAMANLFNDGFADDLFNLRNGMVPFKEGEARALGLFDPEDDEEAPDLRQWLEHDALCPAFAEPKHECTCGLSEAMRRAGML